MSNRTKIMNSGQGLADFDLQTERFSLQPAGQRHVEDLKGILSDPTVVKMLLGNASTPQGTAKEAAKWIDDPVDWTRLGYGSWGIFDRTGEIGEAERLLGIAAASPSLAGFGEGLEIFYFVARDCWGKGVAVEAVTCMCRYLFDRVQVPALEASIFAELNPGSVRLAQKLGMRPAGRVSLRSHGLDDERIQEIVSFDLWRVRTAPVEAVRDVLAEAAFRIGQTLAEGFGAMSARRSELLDSLAAREHDLPSHRYADAELIDRKLENGTKARGLALYRVYRKDFKA